MPRRITQPPWRRGARWAPGTPRGVIPRWLQQQLRDGTPPAATLSAPRHVRPPATFAIPMPGYGVLTAGEGLGGAPLPWTSDGRQLYLAAGAA